jgi:uncharacterized protein YhbP (UPF0306 family)
MEHDIRKLVVEVLEGGHLMSLGVADKGGPWVADVIFVHDADLNIYWMSDPDVRHSRALIEDPQAAGTITISNGPKEPNVGIQFSGQVEKIEGGRLDLELMHAAKRKKMLPTEAGSILEGDSWYVLRPKLIELIYEPLFGFDKQGLELGLEDGKS